MSFDISIYVDPGVYSQEVINPSSLALGQLPTLLAVVGIAPRVAVVSNEAVIRGQVNNEAVTWAGSSPHTYTTTNVATRRQADTTLIKTTGGQNQTMPNNAYQWLPASITGLTGPFDIVSGSFITLELDGNEFISIALTAGSTRTATQVAADINTALAASPAYGVAYNAVATAVAGAIVITSPQTIPANSDLRFIATPPDTVGYVGDDFTLVFGHTNPYIAQSTLQLFDSFYLGTDTYIIDYVAVNTLLDALQNTPVVSLTKVGLYANVTSFQPTIDYQLTSNNVDWTPNVEGVVTGLVGPYNTSVNNVLQMALNGLAVITVTLTSSATLAASAVAASINAALLAQPVYGPLYGNVATVVGGAVVITLPSPFDDLPVAQGVNSTIEFYSVPANAVTTVFGIALTALPFQQTGSANQPVVGATYFASYTYTRPTSAYNNVSEVTNLFFNPQDCLAYTGPITEVNFADNTLGIASSIAFQNNAPRLLLVQVNDSTTPGFPTINEVKAAIDACVNNSDITDLVVLDTRLAVQTYLLTHVTNESSITEKNYRRGWYGMAQNTAVGDIDSPGTFVYAAQVTLQVPPDSPGRGRSIISAPSNVSSDITFADGTDQIIPLDSTYLGVACAALMTSFINLATSLLRKTIVGFDIPSFQTYQKAERRMLASNGVNVVTVEGGQFVLTDPVTTEQGAGNLREFTEINAMVQKDNTTRTVDQTLNTNVVGIVPSDLADFINDIKGFISLALTSLIAAGDIGPYVDANGNTRDINLQTDMQVFQSPTDPTQFIFRYFYNLRYVAKRLFGDYSVDNPFFQTSPNQTATA
jgi:hypothetical protein